LVNVIIVCVQINICVYVHCIRHGNRRCDHHGIRHGIRYGIRHGIRRGVRRILVGCNRHRIRNDCRIPYGRNLKTKRTSVLIQYGALLQHPLFL